MPYAIIPQTHEKCGLIRLFYVVTAKWRLVTGLLGLDLVRLMTQWEMQGGIALSANPTITRYRIRIFRMSVAIGALLFCQEKLQRWRHNRRRSAMTTITAEQLERTAVVYVRQSTAFQARQAPLCGAPLVRSRWRAMES